MAVATQAIVAQEKETAIETEIVVAIRGTLTTDILSDLQCRPALSGGQPMVGQWQPLGFDGSARAHFEVCPRALSGLYIVITGHSLGAACACLLTMLLSSAARRRGRLGCAGGREETDQSGASDEIRPGSVVGTGGAATNTGRTAGTTTATATTTTTTTAATASHANTSPEPGALRNHEIACFAFAPPPVFAFRAQVGACFGSGGGGGGGGGGTSPRTHHHRNGGGGELRWPQPK